MTGEQPGAQSPVVHTIVQGAPTLQAVPITILRSFYEVLHLCYADPT